MSEYQDEIERKFLVTDFPPVRYWPVPFTDFDIVQTYLGNTEGLSERVRVRCGSSTEYTHTTKKFVSSGHFKELERVITQKEYLVFLDRKIQDATSIRKVRRVFEYNQRTWELDVYRSPLEGVFVLEVELPSIDAELISPPFVKCSRELTGEKIWSNRAMAQVGWTPPPPCLQAGQVWTRGEESFQVLTSDGKSGLTVAPRTKRFVSVDLSTILEEGWRLLPS